MGASEVKGHMKTQVSFCEAVSQTLSCCTHTHTHLVVKVHGRQMSQLRRLFKGGRGEGRLVGGDLGVKSQRNHPRGHRIPGVSRR